MSSLYQIQFGTSVHQQFFISDTEAMAYAEEHRMPFHKMIIITLPNGEQIYSGAVLYQDTLIMWEEWE